MNIMGLVKVTVTGINGAGTISAPGLKVGDRLLLGYSPNDNVLEQIISVDDEIQYGWSGDWTPFTFDLIYLRGI